MGDELEWWTFICTSCADETYVGKEPWQSVEDFAAMLYMLHGDPPVCTACLHPELLAD